MEVAPFLVLILLLVVVPLALLASYSFRESSFLGVGSGPTLEQYQAVFENPSTVRVMVKTIVMALAVGAVVTVLAFTIAYALTFRLTGRTALVALGVVVASGVASLLVRIFAWASILGTHGVINSTLEEIGAISSPLGFLIFGYFAISVTMVYLYLPFAALIVYASMQGIDPRALEASRDLGAGRWRTIAKVALPQARVGLLAAFCLTAVFSSADFVTPRLVGGSRGTTVGAMIQDLALTGGDLPGSAALALAFAGLFVLVLGALLLLLRAARPLAGRIGPRVDRVGAAVAERIRSPISQRSLSVPVSGLLLVYLVAPTLLVIVFSFNAESSIGLPITGLTADWYPEIVSRAGFEDALMGSLLVTSVGVVGATVLAVPMAFALTRATGLGKRLLWVAIFLPYVVPGVLLGSALLITATETGAPLGLAATGVVHVMLLVSEITLITYARLTGIDPHLVEAARDLGASAARAARSITLPLLLPAIVGAALLGTAFSLDEIFVTTFTLGTENTLPIWILGQSRIGFTPGINAVGVILLAGTLLIFAVAVTIGRRSVLTTGTV